MQRPFTSILAITDFSEPSRRAVLRAGRLAAATGAALHILHVLQLPALDRLRSLLGDPPADLPERLTAAARFNLDELTHAVGASVAATTTVSEGGLLESVAQAQQSTGADLTVLGARGASVARHLLLGSTADRLLATSRHSMLVVRLSPEVPYRRVLVPVDFSADAALALRRAQALAPEGRVTALHAYEAPFEGKLRFAGVEDKDLRGYVQGAEATARRQMHTLLAAAEPAPPVSPLVLHGHPVAHALDQEEELDCQLVVVGRGSGSRAEDFLLGSVSRRVLSQSRVDVLLSA